MTTAEAKNILANKLKAENTSFTKQDISIRKQGEVYKIVIANYEYIPFTLKTEHDDYFGFCVMVNANNENIIFIDSKTNYDFKTALLELGYYIGTRF